MSYRNAIAAALLLLSLAGCGNAPARPPSTIGTDADRYSRVCRTASEDSPIPSSCNLDPSARYDYDRGAWRQTDLSTVYANGNRPPTGADLIANPPGDDD